MKHRCKICKGIMIYSRDDLENTNLHHYICANKKCSKYEIHVHNDLKTIEWHHVVYEDLKIGCTGKHRGFHASVFKYTKHPASGEIISQTLVNYNLNNPPIKRFTRKIAKLWLNKLQTDVTFR